MPIDKNDLLNNELIEDDSLDNITKEAIKSQVAGALLWSKDKIIEKVEAAEDALGDVIDEFFNEEEFVLPLKKEAKGTEEEATKKKVSLTSVASTRPVLPKPEFSNDLSPETRQLLNNSWDYLQQQMALGSFCSPFTTSPSGHYREARTVYSMLGINERVAENLPHRRFMTVDPMLAPCQVAYEAPSLGAPHNFNGTETVDVSITSVAVEAQTRKLATMMPSEALDDMMLDDREIVEMMSERILAEFHNDMLNKIRETATSSVAVTDKTEEPSAKDIIDQIILLSSYIDEKEHTPNNEKWIIVNPAMAAIMAQDGNIFDTASAHRGPLISQMGTIGGMKVYIDRGVKNNEIFVGKKSNKPHTSPLTYKPYNLVLPMGTVVNPNTFQSEVGFATRGCYHVSSQAEGLIRRTEFKFKENDNKMETTTDAGYFYAPYIPLITTKVVSSEEDLKDVDIPYTPEKQQTIAAILGGLQDD